MKKKSNMLPPPLRTGRITYAQANTKLLAHEKFAMELRSRSEQIAKLVGKPPQQHRFLSNKGNSYLFSREDVLRHFFKDGDITQPTMATHLRIALGVHNRRATHPHDATRHYEVGDRTVMITGVSLVEVKKNELKFIGTTSGKQPVDQYPPVQDITGIEKILPGEPNEFIIRVD